MHKEKPGIVTSQSYRCKGLLIIYLLNIVFIQDFHSKSKVNNTSIEIGHPFIENFNSRDYGAHQQNWAVAQDQRGIMYFGNVAGVLEYDGINWRLITLPNKSMVRSLAVDSKDRIYVGAYGEFGYLNPNQQGLLEYKSLVDFVPNKERGFNNIWKIHITTEGVYFRSSTHIFHWFRNSMSVLKPDTEFHRSFVIKDMLYVRQWELGLFKLVGDSLELVPGGELFAEERIDLMVPLEDEKKLIGSKTNGLFIFNEDELKPYNSEVDSFLRKNQLYDGIVLQNGNIALATLRGGLAIIDKSGNFIQRVGKETGLRDNTIWALSADREGGLWMALNDGIARVEIPSPILLFNEKLGIQSNVESIIRHRGNIYAATGLGVYYLNIPSKFGDPAVFKALPGINSQAWSIISTANALLAATSNGVYQIIGNNASPLMNSISFSLMRSRADTNRVFVGLVDGLAILELLNGKWQYRGRVEGISEEIRSIAEDGAKTLWMGTQFEGVLHLKTPIERITSIRSEQKLLVEKFGPESMLPEGEVNVFWINNKILFGTSRGIRIFDASKRSFAIDSAYGNNYADTNYAVPRISKDQKGDIWIVRGQRNKFEIGRITKIAGDQNDLNYSPLWRVTELGPVWTIYADTENEAIVWFGGNGWIAKFNGSASKKYDLDYSAMVRRVIVKGDSIIYGGSSKSISQLTYPNRIRNELNYDNNGLRFEFAAASFDGSSQNQYQYLLEGFENNWSNWSKETIKDYTNLTEGTYLFHVRAKNIYRYLSREDIFLFTILPPWYRTWLAYIFYILIFGGLVYGFIIYQIKKIRSRETERARLKEAQLIKQKNIELDNKNKELEFVLEKLNSAQDSLIDSESKFRSVAESANDAIITTDNSGNIIFWNKRAEEIFGHSKKEIMGKSLKILMPERYRKAHQEGFDNFHKTGEGKIIGQIVDVHAIKKNGIEFPIELTLGHWESHEGKFVTGIVRDITARKQKEADLQKTKTQLLHSEKMATLGKLSAGMAHELNNPASVALRGSKRLHQLNSNLEKLLIDLGRIKLSDHQFENFNEFKDQIYHRSQNNIDLDPILRSDRESEIESWLDNWDIDETFHIVSMLSSLNFSIDELDKIAKKFTHEQFPVIISSLGNIYASYNLLDEIEHGTNRITEIVKSLKSYSYLDKAEIQLINIHEGINDTLVMMRNQLKDSIIVQKEFDENIPNIEVYGSELNQVWTNIIDNAISAMNGEGKIIIKTFMEDEFVVVQIQDSGVGIPKEIHGKVFDPFFTTKPPGEGTGLGLNISHNIIVKKHNGKISFHSSDKGTCFEIRLPLKSYSGKAKK